MNAGDRRRAASRPLRPMPLPDPQREVAMVLGDSLLWAGDCVWLQPCSRALAEALRRQFHPHLPPDRLQRILHLRGTRVDADGFRFATPVRNALRALWKRRRSEPERRQVLDFIARRVDQAEPEDADSLAHLSWQAVRERFLLESRPNHSPRRLAELAQLLAPSIQESLHDFRVGPARDGDQRTVLETACDDPKSQQYLASISDRLDIPFYRRLPLSRRNKGILGTLAAMAIVCLLGTLGAALNPRIEYWQIADAGAEPYELYEIRADEEPTLLGVWGQQWTGGSPVPRHGREYRVLLHSGEETLRTPAHRYVGGQHLSISPAIGLPPAEQPAWQKFVWIPPGEFLMGSPESEPGHRADEHQHPVTITRGFWLAATPVTQRQYLEVMDENPSSFKEAGLDAPVERVSWEDATLFCQRLTQRERDAGRLADGWEYRLPTEAQWEYACRAGSQTAYFFGDDPAQLAQYAWFGENSGRTTHPVGMKQPNAFGLYDMHGNVWEWCNDWHDSAYYVNSPLEDPAGPTSGSSRVNRGGSWFHDAGGCRSAYRNRDPPSFRSNSYGFRVAFSLVDQSGR